jgi:thiol-disulfide isomerase/thioredoxin
MKNMKNSTTFLFLLIAFLGFSCSSAPEGTVIRGDIENAGNLQAFVDEVVIGKASNILAKTEIDPSGHFEVSFPEGLDQGIYNLRIGAKRINLILDGDEDLVTVKGDLNTLQDFDFEVSGSEDTQQFMEMARGLKQRQVSSADIQSFVEETDNPMLGAYLAYLALQDDGQFIDIHKAAHAKLAAAQPDAEMTSEYGKFISAVEMQYAARMASERIRVGQPAPDIRLAGPDGKEYALSDLKGKVVLLDFWASWCGPCRRENPHVVEVYKKYKDDGFTVFSVSLDGIDSRTAARYSSEAQVEEVMERSRQRWVQAIEQDGLVWESHVSDLKKWESAPAATYGVRGIPKTFLIDREGKIAEIGLRGAAQIERALQKYL